MESINLQELTDDELAELLERIEDEQQRRSDERKRRAKQEILEKARNSGIDLEDLEKEASEGVIYRNPNDPWQTWKPGRGRRPNWVNEWLASGRKLEELEDRGRTRKE